MELDAIKRILTKIDPVIMSHPIKWLECNEGSHYIHEKASDEFKLWWNIRKVGQLGRRTGTGVTAYADMLAALGLPYGHEEVTNRIFKLKLQAELDASIDLAILRGVFPLWDTNREYWDVSSGAMEGRNQWYDFIMMNFNEQWQRMVALGRRNAGISTIAPVGTGSLMAQTTSGIEPLFKPYYLRRKKCALGEKPDFVDENGIEYTEHIVLHPKFKIWYNINKDVQKERIEKEEPERDVDWTPVEELTVEQLNKSFEYSPWYKQTAEDINPTFRVKTQALIQKYITSSISSTVNLPNSATEKDVEDIYLEAFTGGCKGITVYRDGSRSGVLVDVSTKRGITHENGVVKRPKKLEADYYQVKANGISYVVLIGILEGKPYEVFVFEPTEPIKQKEGKGTITKVKKGHYNFDSEFLAVSDLQLANDRVEERACSLYASMLLRHGAEPKYVIKTTKKVDEGITSFASAMCRVLGKYTQKEVVNEPCPECGGELLHEGGCIHCLECEYSRCS